MKRSTVNRAIHEARECFVRHGWALPQHPRWDVTDFGLDDFGRFGLTLVNLASEPEYCEKLMYARCNQTTPCHTHRLKKEDIICRAGVLMVKLWAHQPDRGSDQPFDLKVKMDGEIRSVHAGECLTLAAGSRVTLPPGIWHEFYPGSDECIIGEVSTANDDHHDNVFANPAIGRFAEIIEDEPAKVRLISGT